MKGTKEIMEYDSNIQHLCFCFQFLNLLLQIYFFILLSQCNIYSEEVFSFPSSSLYYNGCFRLLVSTEENKTEYIIWSFDENILGVSMIWRVYDLYCFNYDQVYIPSVQIKRKINIKICINTKMWVHICAWM